jgi:hypothetical protein
VREVFTLIAYVFTIITPPSLRSRDILVKSKKHHDEVCRQIPHHILVEGKIYVLVVSGQNPQGVKEHHILVKRRRYS